MSANLMFKEISRYFIVRFTGTSVCVSVSERITRNEQLNPPVHYQTTETFLRTFHQKHEFLTASCGKGLNFKFMALIKMAD